MAAPAFGARGTYLSGSTTTTAAVPVPPGVTSGQVVLVHLYKESTATVTPPAGFTELTPAPTTTGNVISHHVFWKRATGSDSGTYSFTWTGSAYREAVAERYTGCIASGSPVDAYNGAGRSSSGTVTPAVTVTTTGPDRLLVWSGANFASGTWTPPSAGGTWTERYDSGDCLTIATREQATSGSSGSVTGECAASANEAAFLVALLPTASNVSVSDTIPAALEVRAPSDESFVALSDVVTLSDPEPSSARVGAPADESVSVSLLPDEVLAQLLVGAPDGGSVDVSVDDPAAADVLVRSPAGETVEIEEPGLPAGGQPHVTAWIVDGDNLIPLPHLLDVSLNPQRSSPGSWEFEYPVYGANFDLVREAIQDDRRRLELEFWVGGRRFNAQRGLMVQASGNEVAENSTWRFGGHFLEWLMTDARVVHDPEDEKGEVHFSAATAGFVMRQFMLEAQARGTLEDVDFSTFSVTHDSNGTPWQQFVTIKFTPYKTSYLGVLDKLVALGMCEWELDAEHKLRLYGPGGRGRDLTARNPPTRLKRATSLSESDRKIDLRGVGTDLFGTGAEGLYSSSFSGSARARLGAQIERDIDSSNIEQQQALDGFVQVNLEKIVEPVVEITHGLVFGTNLPAPVSGFRVGDWLYSDVGRGLERVRVVQWELKQGVSGVTGSVTLNDQIGDRLSRLQKQIDNINDGSAVVGTSVPPPTPDTTPPSPPTGLVASSIAYQDGQFPETWALVTVGWEAVPDADVAGYHVRYAYLALDQVGPPYTGGPEPVLHFYEVTPEGGTTLLEWSFGGVGAGANLQVQVQAFDRTGNYSAWSTPLQFTTAADATAPPIPTAPTLEAWFNSVTVLWDGFEVDGAEMRAASPDFRWCEVHLSADAGFTPDRPVDPLSGLVDLSSSTTFKGYLTAAGAWNVPDLPYSVGVFSKLVAVDRNENASDPSAAGGPATPNQLVTDDLINDIITSEKIEDFAVNSAKIVDAAIISAKIADLAVNDAKITTLSAGKITTGTMIATVTLSGIIQTAASGQRMRIDSTGWQAYNASGTLFAQLDITGASLLVTGTYQSALTGERVVIATDGSLRFYPSAGTNYSRMMNEGNDIVFRGPLDSNQRSGRVNVNSIGAGINFSSESDLDGLRGEMVVTDRLARMIAPVIIARIDERFTAPDGGGRRFTFVVNDSDGDDIGASVLNYTARSTDDRPALTGLASGVAFGADGLAVTTGASGTFGAVGASAFNVGSAEDIKTDIGDARTLIPDLLQVVRDARAKKFRYIWDDPETETPRFGPLVEDLPPALQQRVELPDGTHTEGVDLARQYGILWAVVGQLLDQETRLVKAAAPLPNRLNANENYDITVPWDGGPVQSVPAPVSVVPYGPTNLQLRAITSEVIATTESTVTVRVRAKRLVINLDAEDHLVVAGIYTYIPPYTPEGP